MLGRDALLRVRDIELKHGRGAPRPYLLGLCLNDLENRVPNRRFVHRLLNP
jgi:hypothetical protein